MELPTHSAEAPKSSTNRILIGKVDLETGEIVRTSGKRRKKQIDEEVIDREIAEYNTKLHDRKKDEKEILSGNSSEFETLKRELDELQSKTKQLGQIMITFADSINRLFGNDTLGEDSKD